MASTTTSTNNTQSIWAYDPILNKSFKVQGTSANGAINVNGTFSISGSPLPITGATTGIGVAILDGSGNQITSFGGGTQYLINTVNASPTGTLALGYDGGTVRGLFTDATGRLILGAGANVIGKIGIDQTGPGTTNRVDIADSLNQPVSAFPATFLRTTDEPHQVFYDPFDTTLDVTNRWTSTQGSSGVAASTTAGVMSMGTGTVANGYSKLISQPSFTLPIPAWLGISDAIAIPDLAAPTANAYRFWGVGTTPATPTAAAPLTDAVGFELTTAGKMFAVVYAGGTRTAVQDLSSSGNVTQPTDANNHRYITYVRTDKTYWYIDGITSANLVATSNFQAPQVQTLPKLFLAVGGATPPGSNSQITCSGATAWDTGKNTSQIADGTFPWRKATISGAGALSVTLAANQSVNIAQINGITPLMGNGVTGTGSQRVTIASDNTPFTVNAAQSTAANLNATVVGTGTFSIQTTAQVPGVGATNLGKAEDAASASGDTGIFMLAVRNDNAATSTTNANADYSQTSVDITGTQFTRLSPSNTPTLANVAGSVTSVTLLAANAARRLCIIYNDSTSDMYVKFGTTASSTSFSIYLPSLGTTTFNGEDYAGIVTGIWISAAGNARTTETTI